MGTSTILGGRVTPPWRCVATSMRNRRYDGRAAGNKAVSMAVPKGFLIGGWAVSYGAWNVLKRKDTA